MPEGGSRARKVAYFKKLEGLLGTYRRVLLVSVDNVSSAQMQQTRSALRGRAELLMGKNTMIRKVLREFASTKNPKFEILLPHVKGNVGFVFTNEDLSEIRGVIIDNKIEAPAKAGAVAPCDVVVPAGQTGMEPTKTSFFQNLSINTKITRGTIEILQDVALIYKGSKVTPSQAALLQMLGIRPFRYGMDVTTVYDDGSIYPPHLLDLTDDDVLQKFRTGVANIAALGLQIGFPTLASLPHSILNGYKNVLAVSIATDYTFKGSEEIKKILEDPAAFAAAQAASGPAPAAAAAEEEKKPEEEEEEEEEDVGLGGGLFGDDDDDDDW